MKTPKSGYRKAPYLVGIIIAPFFAVFMVIMGVFGAFCVLGAALVGQLELKFK